MPKVYIVLLDMDGCFFNPAYHDKANQAVTEKTKHRKGIVVPQLCDVAFLPDEFIRCNQLFFKYYLEQREALQAEKNIIGLSTNRQSFFLDYQNGYPNPVFRQKNMNPRYVGSCTTAIMAVESHLQAIGYPTFIDPYLLSDKDNNRMAGHNFMRIVNLISRPYSDNTSQANAFEEAAKLDQCATFDKLKCELIQDRVDRAVQLHPGKKIIIEHVDDMPKILDKLYQHFSSQPNKLPKCVTLHLCEYNGAVIQKFKLPIEGKGPIPETTKAPLTCYTTSEEIKRKDQEQKDQERKDQELQQRMPHLLLSVIERIVTHACWAQEGQAFCGTKLPRIIEASQTYYANGELSNLISFIKQRNASFVGKFHGFFGTRSHMTRDFYDLMLALAEKDKFDPEAIHLFVIKAKTFVEKHSAKFGPGFSLDDLLDERLALPTVPRSNEIKPLCDAATAGVDNTAVSRMTY